MIEAHGGLAQFRQFSHLTARLHQFGILWDLKGGWAETLLPAIEILGLLRIVSGEPDGGRQRA
ncbi:hypothetical protein B5V03_14735 [Bradyrhizobium betae]|uniref:Uncharacterized protein n=1 Tax=Bradyrhizobium betae TaxID=244734 RepID=A0A4Q1VF59_9BRAD|nr:hypothetical protein B5V03_14735 [Bradyrhizobium betae]